MMIRLTWRITARPLACAPWVANLFGGKKGVHCLIPISVVGLFRAFLHEKAQRSYWIGDESERKRASKLTVRGREGEGGEGEREREGGEGEREKERRERKREEGEKRERREERERREWGGGERQTSRATDSEEEMKGVMGQETKKQRERKGEREQGESKRERAR
eukprot:2923560-Rhodomonas_salina.1